MILLLSCDSRSEASSVIVVDDAVIEGLSDSLWTYFSFSKGMVVGQSRFGSTEDDAAWFSRTDWDFAVCGDKLRTNGGESGKGFGGVQIDSTTNYLLLDIAPEDGYIIDSSSAFRRPDW